MRRMVGLGVVAFCGAFGATLGLRLSEGVLAVLAGVVLGGGLVVMMGAVVAWVVVRERRAEGCALPPPSAVEYWRRSAPGSAARPSLPAAQRRFYLVGEDGEVIELTPSVGERMETTIE